MERRWSQAVRFFWTGLLLVFARNLPEVSGQCCFVVNTPSRLLIYNAASAYLTVPQNAIVNSSVPLPQNGQESWIALDQKPWDQNQQAYYDQAGQQQNRNDGEKRIYPVKSSGHNLNPNLQSPDNPQQWTYSTPRQQNPVYLAPNALPSSTLSPPQQTYPYGPNAQYQPVPQYEAPPMQQTQNQGSQQYQPTQSNSNLGPNQWAPSSQNAATSSYNAANDQTRGNGSQSAPIFIPVIPYANNNPQRPPSAGYSEGQYSAPSGLAPRPILPYNQGNENYNLPPQGQQQTVEGEIYSGGGQNFNQAANQPISFNNNAVPPVQPAYNRPSDQFQAPNSPQAAQSPPPVQTGYFGPGGYNQPSSEYGYHNGQLVQSGASGQGGYAAGQYPPIAPLAPSPNSPSSQYSEGQPGLQYQPPPLARQNGTDVYHDSSVNYGPLPDHANQNPPQPPSTNEGVHYGEQQLPNQQGNVPISYNQDHSEYGINEGRVGSSPSAFQDATSSPASQQSFATSSPSSGIQSQTIQYPPPTETPQTTANSGQDATLDHSLSESTNTEMPVSHPGYEGYPYTNYPSISEDSSSTLPSQHQSSFSQTANSTTGFYNSETPNGQQSTSQFDYPAPGGHISQDQSGTPVGSSAATTPLVQHDQPSTPGGQTFLYPYSNEGRNDPNAPSRDQPQGTAETTRDPQVHDSASSNSFVFALILVYTANIF